MKDHTLFFIAIVFPEAVSLEITELKRAISDKYHTRKALNSPPHITLVPPFWYPTLKKSALISTVSQLNRDFNSSLSDEVELDDNLKIEEEELAPLIVNLNGFGTFPHNVLFITVEENESLSGIRDMAYGYLPYDLKMKVKKHEPFKPHITLAFKDISDENFQEVGREYLNQTYEKNFEVESAHLLEHNGKVWKVN